MTASERIREARSARKITETRIAEELNHWQRREDRIRDVLGDGQMKYEHRADELPYVEGVIYGLSMSLMVLREAAKGRRVPS